MQLSSLDVVPESKHRPSVGLMIHELVLVLPFGVFNCSFWGCVPGRDYRVSLSSCRLLPGLEPEQAHAGHDNARDSLLIPGLNTVFCSVGNACHP